MSLYRRKILDLSNQKYMDDYESRLEQAESGIRDLNVDLSKIRSGDALVGKNKRDTFLPCSPHSKNELSRDSRVKEDTLKCFSRNTPFKSKTVSSKSPHLPNDEKNFSPVLRDFSRHNVNPYEPPNSSDRLSSKLRNKADNDNSERLRQCYPTVTNDSYKNDDCYFKQKDYTTKAPHFKYQHDGLSTLKRTESNEGVNTLMSPSSYTKSPSQLKKHPYDFSFSDTQNHRLSLRMLDKEAEERISNETEKIFKKANDDLLKHKRDMDSLYGTKLSSFRRKTFDDQSEAIHEMKNLEAKFHEQESQVFQWREKYTDLSKDYEEALHQLTIIKTKLERVERYKEQADAATSELQKQYSIIKNDFDRSELLLLHQKGTIERLQSDVDNMIELKSNETNEKKALEKQVDVLNKEKEVYEKELNLLKSTCDTFETKYSECFKNVISLQTTVDEQTEYIQKLEKNCAQLEDDLVHKKQSEICHMQMIEELKEKDRLSQQQQRLLLQKCTESEEIHQQTSSLQDQYESLKKKQSATEEELVTATREIKRLFALNEQYAVDLRTCQNDNLLLTQENVKLRKDYEGIKKLSNSNPIVNNVAYSLTTKPCTRFTCNEWDNNRSITQHDFHTTTIQTPLHTKPIAQEIPPILQGGTSPQFQDSSKTLMSNEKNNSTNDTMCSNQPDTTYNIYQIEALKKQLILLEAEKNQLESDLGKIPQKYYGRNCERFNQIKLERELVEVDASIHRIRQELRFCGNFKKQQFSYV
ncbi:ankyrin repeat domain-containing protein 26-like isoform X2 [Hylaeus volcanicus]|uniref:ankyrin repeat domain-containing protein 26-like isoform X2 n=1 Tax=Hylaeus volcanicus TaxID=313075 RepID=UPI0023B87AFE|nr:ankyrin repeat domain-containing protein 26-like isoform X2 [Hylaeus volcanicus]